MRLVAGLGNPGIKFIKNRHNIGFMLLDNYLSKVKLEWKTEKKIDSQSILYNGVLFIKPQLFMNNSGIAVKKAVEYYKIKTSDILIMHDDVDLEAGKIKTSSNSGSAGHNGVQSIINELGTSEFKRIRVGVGRPLNKNISTEDWVLSDIDALEIENIVKSNIVEQILNEFTAIKTE